MPPLFYLTLFLLTLKISFIADQKASHLLIGIGPRLIQPPRHIPKRLPITDIIHQNHPYRPSVVRTCNRLESFLSRLPLTTNTVSQICSLINLSATLMILDPNYTPIVVSCSNLNFLSRNCRSIQLFPTPSSPNPYSCRLSLSA